MKYAPVANIDIQMIQTRMLPSRLDVPNSLFTATLIPLSSYLRIEFKNNEFQTRIDGWCVIIPFWFDVDSRSPIIYSVNNHTGGCVTGWYTFV